MYESNKFFLNYEIAHIIENELEFRRKNEINLFSYCIMPDHIHLLISFRESYKKSLQIWISSFKRHTLKTVKEKFRINKLWHVNFYDHIVRKSEDMETIVQYILQNPVRKNMVNEWYEYPFSKIYTDD